MGVLKRSRTDGMQTATDQRIDLSDLTQLVVCRKYIIFNKYPSICMILLIFSAKEPQCVGLLKPGCGV